MNERAFLMSDEKKSPKTETDPKASNETKASDETTVAPTNDEVLKGLSEAVKKYLTPEQETEQVESTVEDTGFLYMHGLDPARQLPRTAPYLDEAERELAEVQRAKVEGNRKPDLKNPPSMQGTPYRSVDQLKSELPPHASLDPDVTLPVVVTK